MKRDPRLSYPSLRVLWLLLHSPHDPICGADLTRELRISSGTLYPILVNFRNAGWIKSHRERGNSSKLARPLRTFYALTEKGRKKTRTALVPLQFNSSQGGNL